MSSTAIVLEENLRPPNEDISSHNEKKSKNDRLHVQFGVGRRKSVQFTYRPTIVFDSVSKNYGKNQVLRNLNITVKENTIYGLYGKSGSGKSVALACLLGNENLNSGNIFIRGEKIGEKGSGIPGKRVGFMPQTTSLNEEFTMKETLHYFGRIYGISYEEVEERKKYYIELLHLESCKEQIRHMCDDTRRLVSFATALLHLPEILVMDEPTVGMDPASRERIWRHLTELVAESKTTVILATNSVNEVTRANTIGILRHGRLAMEDSPSNLLLKFVASSLDDVMLQICQQDNQNKSSQRRWDSIDIAIKEKETGRIGLGLSGKTIGSLLRQSSWNVGKRDWTRSADRLQALFIKNILIAYRSLWLILFLVVLPPLTIYFVSMTVKFPPNNLNFGLISNELIMNGSQTTLFDSEDCQTLITCQYIKRLTKSPSLNINHFNSEKEASESIRNGNIWGYMSISNDIVGQINPVDTMHGHVWNTTRPVVNVKLDNINAPLSLWLKTMLLSNFFESHPNTSLSYSCHQKQTKILPYIMFESAALEKEQESLSDFIVPGITIHILTFYAILISALVFIHEKESGIFKRLYAVGVRHFEIIFSHLSFLFLLLLCQTTISFLLMFYVFNVPQLGSSLLAYTLVITHGISGLIMGVLVASIFKNTGTAILAVITMSVPTLVISGSISPVEGFPWILKYFGLAYPGILPALSIKNILLRGWGLSHFDVWIGFVSSFAFSTLYLVTTYIYHKIKFSISYCL